MEIFMYIKHLHITSFGALTNRDVPLSRGLNVIEGPNESGKTAAVMFIKFIFYGLSGAKGSAVTERQKYINWKTGAAAGYAICELDDGRVVKIERILSLSQSADGKARYRESVKTTDAETNMPVSLPSPIGEHLLGVPESVFVNTAFVRQQFGIKPDASLIGQSVENIICAADENISVKKALDEIDKARIQLLYKNKNGGLIYELLNKKDALIREAEENREISGETIRTEAALTELQPMKESALKRKEQLDETFDALEIIVAKRKLDAARKLDEEIRRTRDEIEEETSSAVNGEFIKELDSCERDIERYESLPASEENYIDDIEDRYLNDDEDFEDVPGDDVSAANKIHRKSRVSFALSALLALIGLFGVVATFLIYYLNIGEYIIPAIATAGVLAASAIFFAVNGKQRKDVGAILDYWGADSLETLEDCIDKALESRKKYKEIKRERENLEADARAAYSAYESATSSLGVLAERAGIKGATRDDPQGLIDVLRNICKDKAERIAELETKAANLEGRLSAIEDQTADYDASEILEKAVLVMNTPMGAKAAAMSSDEIKEAARERSFCANRYAGLLQRENELECNLAALRASAKSPADAAEQISQIDSQIKKLTDCHDAYIIAYEKLVEASENMRQSIIPRVAEQTSSIMEEISAGKYAGLGIDPNFDMHFSSDSDGTWEIDYLSSGTGDAAYISLRLALIKAFYDGQMKPPVVFDESFSRLDEKRLEAAIRAISSEKFGLQTILCSCRELEVKLADKYGASRISLAKSSD